MSRRADALRSASGSPTVWSVTGGALGRLRAERGNEVAGRWAVTADPAPAVIPSESCERVPIRRRVPQFPRGSPRTARVGHDRIWDEPQSLRPRSCLSSCPAPPAADLFLGGSAPVPSRQNDEALESTSAMDLCAETFTTNEQRIGPTVFGTGSGGGLLQTFPSAVGPCLKG